MKINDTEYQLPENIELLILSLLPDQNYGPEWVNVSESTINIAYTSVWEQICLRNL